MTDLVFLEAATQSPSAASIIETNEALINFATAEVDALVEEQALHTAWHVGAFVENDSTTTYENVKEPIEDLVAEATSIFAEIIASDTSDADKKALIEGYAHIIAMGGCVGLFEFNPAGLGRLANGHSSGAVAGSFAGAAAGAAVGAGAGAAIKLFSKERKIWKNLVKQEKEAHTRGANAVTLKKIHDAKIKAKEKYLKSRSNAMTAGKFVGGAVGAVGGGMLGKGVKM